MKSTLRNVQYENFILSDIVRPYQNLIGYETQIERLVYSNSDTDRSFNYNLLAGFALHRPDWFEKVVSRLSRIYERMDWSFFPNNDPFASLLKDKLTLAGVSSYKPRRNGKDTTP